MEAFAIRLEAIVLRVTEVLTGPRKLCVRIELPQKVQTLFVKLRHSVSHTSNC